MTRLISLFALCFMITLGAHAQLDEAKNAYNSGAESVQNGNLEEAIDAFNNALDYLDEYGEEDEQAMAIRSDIEKRLPGLYYQLATDYAKADKNDEAIETLETTIELADYYGDESTVEKAENLLPQLYYLKAVGFYKQSDFDQALTELKQAFETNPTYIKAHYLEAVIYRKQENDEALENVAKKAMDIEDEDETVNKITTIAHNYFLKKGNAAKKSANYDEAIQHLEKSLTFDKTSNTAYLLLLKCYSSKEDWSEAIETAKTALDYVEDDDKQSAVYYELGKAYAGLGDTQEACKAYSNANGNYEENANYQMQHVLKCN